MPGRWPLDLDAEFEELIEQRGLPVQMRYREARLALGLAFQQSEPQQRSQDTGFHGEWPEIRSRFHYGGRRNRAKPRQLVRAHPVIGRGRQRPQHDADIVLRPGVDRVPVEIAEVQVSEGDVKEKRLQGPAPLWDQHPFAQAGRHQRSAMCSDQLGPLGQYADEIGGVGNPAH